MDMAEQIWRAGDYVQIVREEATFDVDETLTPDQEPSLEETLTENNAALVLEGNWNKGVGSNNDAKAAGNARKTNTAGNAEEAKNNAEGENLEREVNDPDRECNLAVNAHDSGIGKDSKVDEVGNDLKLYELVVDDVNESGGDEIFEDCVEDATEDKDSEDKNDMGGNEKGDFDRVKVNYSLEMKLTLGIEDKN